MVGMAAVCVRLVSVFEGQTSCQTIKLKQIENHSF
jgi:hypothetical protein